MESKQPVSKEQAMQMFSHDLDVLMDDVRGMLAHYQIADWEAYILIRKPQSPESYVLKYEAAAGDSFAHKLVGLHQHDDDTLSTAVRQMRQRHKHKAELANFEDCNCEDCRSLEAAMGGS